MMYNMSMLCHRFSKERQGCPEPPCFLNLCGRIVFCARCASCAWCVSAQYMRKICARLYLFPQCAYMRKIVLISPMHNICARFAQDCTSFPNSQICGRFEQDCTYFSNAQYMRKLCPRLYLFLQCALYR